jgi:predicted RNase H-like HicB family nuclease
MGDSAIADLETNHRLKCLKYSGLLVEIAMKAELTAIIEKATEGGYWAICPEIPGANGQGETIEEAKGNLKLAIQLIIEDRMADIRRGLTEDAIEETILIP